MIQASSPSSWFQHVSRTVAVTASTGAAVVSILTALYSYGVLGKSESHQSIGNVGAAWVRLRPAVDTATAIGDTVQFAATIADRKGSILVGAAPVWTTGDSSVAVAAGDGSVIARGPGTTTLTVVVGSIVSTAHVVVQPRVASVAIERAPADSVATLLEGGSVQLHARPMDARGHRVAGRTVTWHSDDTTIVSIDAHGLATAQQAGRGAVSVTVDGATDRLPVAVRVTASALAAVAGSDQRGPAGRPLPQQVVVRATNRKGAPAPGRQVTFRLAGAQGHLDPVTATTDADGRARTQWTLGEDPGRQLLTAAVENVDSTITVAAEADPVAANTRVVAVNETLRARAAAVLTDSVAVRVTDSTGRPLAGVPVRWEAAKGSAEGVEPRTDSLGIARARWTLGPATGAQRLHAFVGAPGSHVAPAVIVATAMAGAPASIVVAGGDRQRGVAGASLPQPVVARVLDAAGNPVAGAAVSLALSAGTVTDSSLASDSSGFVRLRWTMGRSAGEHSLTMRVEGIVKPVRLTARAGAGRAANLSFDDAPAAHGAHGEKRLVAVVADVYGNPVADAPVAFAVKGGAVSPARAMTDAHGRVALRWTMARTAPDQRLVGTVRGTDVSGAYLAQVAQAHAEPASSRGRRGTR